MFTKPVLIIMLVLNAVVLLGQLWPAGAPPFASVVNIITIGLDLLLVVSLIRQKVK